MIYPDCDMRAWEICDSSVVLANADNFYSKQQTDELLDSVSGMSPDEVQTMINRSLHSKADKTYVDEQDSSLSNDIRAINAQLTQIYKKSDVNNLLDRKQNVLIAGSGITISGDVISSTGGGGDVTSGQVQSMIDHSISGKVDTSTFNTYSASTNVAINNKQDTLIAGDNITIVNNVISSTASGDVTSAQVETMIATSISGKADTTAVTQDIATATADMATQTWVQNQGYLTEHQSLSAYSTTDEMNDAITAATDDMATETWVNQQGFLTEHQSLSAYSTTQEMNEAISSATDDMATQTWVQNQGYLTEHQSLSAYSTTDEMNQAISAATDDMATETWVGNQGYITGVDLSNYATLQDIPTSNSALTNDAGYITSAALNGYATEQWVQNQGYLTEHQSLSAYSTTVEVNNAIDAAVSGKADSTAVTQDIAAATDDMATETWVQNQGYLTEHQSLSAYSTTVEMNNAIDSAVSGKQDTLISGTNIKTINNVSILGSGNVDIQGSGNPTVEVTQAEYNALVSAGTVSADTFYIITDATAGDLSNYYTKSETSGATQISTALNAKADTATTYTKTEVDTALGGKQATLLSGTNISITTGETADTINCTLPITATSSVFDTISVGQGSGGGGYNTLIGPNAKCNSSSKYNVFLVAQKSSSSGNGAYVNGTNNVIIGSIKEGYLNFSIPSFTTSNSVVIGGGGISTDKDNSVAIGYQANVSGTTKTNINNQLTIDTSNQVYISNSANTSTYCLQEKIENTEAALGGLKLVKLSQSEYDSLATKDNSTLYIIV